MSVDEIFVDYEEIVESKAYWEGFMRGSDRGWERHKNGIGAGASCFLVRDKRLGDSRHYFFKWLENNGFKKWPQGHGWWDGVDWIYINLNSKLYNPGMPGVGITSTVCNHVITIKEFLQIYFIYKKYEGKKPLEF